MKKGALIASILTDVVGLIMIFIGSIFYDSILTNWNDWILWFGIILLAIGLIVLVVAFVKKPSEEEVKTNQNIDP